MTSRIAARRLASMRSRLEKRRASGAGGRTVDRSPSFELVAKVVGGAVLVFLWLMVVALAPTTIAAVAVLAVLSALLVSIRRARHSVPGASRDGKRWWSRDARWGTLAVSSVALLVVALVAPRGYDVLLAALGLAGMAVMRLQPVEPIPALKT